MFETQGCLRIGRFQAMANPCAVFIEHQNHDDKQTALIRDMMQKMAAEVWRIEQKYSRYLVHSIIGMINQAMGKAIAIDNETYYLLQLADVLWQESEGRFDITSGTFRKIWVFNQEQQSAQLPTQSQIDEQLKNVGWQRVNFDQQHIQLPETMQIDFGGIGKEYAADRCLAIVDNAVLGCHIMVNLGGDIAANDNRLEGKSWQVGIEDKQGKGVIWQQIPLSRGAIATSGDVYKSICYQGKRYSHIINALTGYPVTNSPSTVTIAAPNCTEAGMLSTLAMLYGQEAETFLQQQQRPYWLQQ